MVLFIVAMIRRCLMIAALGVACSAQPALAAGYVPGEVVVRYASEADAKASGAAPSTAKTRVVRTRPGQSVAERAAQLRRRPGVLSATPNFIARASEIPNDPGVSGVPGGWQDLQWNFVGPFGINVQPAWENVERVGRAGGSDVVIAVLDTGVAYRDAGRYGRSPDLRGNRFVRGYDFVDRDTRPYDENGHGTHIASTIAESVDNGVGATGIAFGAKIMPVRVLDRRGLGDSVAIARGIRYAVRKRVDIINLSFELRGGVLAREIPHIVAALAEARRRGIVVVAAAGNGSQPTLRRNVSYPARVPSVIAVGATTERGCLSGYANVGRQLDLVAPGGGPDAVIAGDPACRPNDPPGRDIAQMTFDRKTGQWGIPKGYFGTSMAAAHVSGTAALIIASGVIGPNPTPRAIERQLKRTARDLGAPGRDRIYGAGSIDAAAATTAPAG